MLPGWGGLSRDVAAPYRAKLTHQPGRGCGSPFSIERFRSSRTRCGLRPNRRVSPGPGGCRAWPEDRPGGARQQVGDRGNEAKMNKAIRPPSFAISTTTSSG